MATVENGRGIFVFGNGDYRARVSTIDQVVASVVSDLGWQQVITPTKGHISKDFAESIVGEYENLTPHYFSPFAKIVRIEKQGDQFFLLNSESKQKPLPIIFTARDKFRVNELVSSQLGITSDKQGETYITLEQPGHALVSKVLRKLVKNKELSN